MSKTPVVKLNANRVSINMISAINNQGKVRFRGFDGTMNSGILIDFCKRLVKSANRPYKSILKLGSKAESWRMPKL